MGAHVGLLPDRTPLWRLFPLPGTTTRRLSPQKHPSDPPCRPSGCGGLPLASSQQHGQLDLWAGRAGNKTNLDWWRVTDSTHRPHRAPCCVTARAGSSSSHPRAIDGRRPSSPRTQPCTISGSEDKQHAGLLRASKDAVNTTPTDTSAGHRHFHVASSFGIGRRSDRQHKAW